MKLTVALKALGHLLLAPNVILRSHGSQKIYYSTAMRHAKIVLGHIAKERGGKPWKSLIAPNISKLGSDRLRAAYTRVSRKMYGHASRENLIFVNWGYSALDRVGFMPEELGFTSYYVENDLFGFGRDQGRPVIGYLIDSQRPYFDGRGPSDLEGLLNAYQSGAWKSDPDAVALLDGLRSSPMHKYSQYSASADELGIGPEDLVVFGQVESDAAWVKNLSSVRTNVEIVERAVAVAGPGGRVLYKAHPKHKTWKADEKLIAERFPQVVQVDPKVSFKSMLVKKPRVMVNTSGTGLDAGLAGCEVMTVGLAFYAGWGATRDLGPVTERRHNRLTFEDIVIVIISQYGRYFRRETLETIGLKEIAAEIVKPRG